MSKLVVTLCTTAFVLLILMIGVGLYYRYDTKPEPIDFLPNFKSNSVEGVYKTVAATADAPYCATFGREILQKNGSAMDAAISMLLCMGVVIPESMGLGGGCIITHYDSTTKTSVVIDGREVAPLKAANELYAGKEDATVIGPLAIAVPGELRAYWEAHQRFGKLPWKDLFDGAIRISEKGFVVNEHLANAMSDKRQYIKDGTLRSVFWNPETNDLFKEGDTIRRPDLARTFRRLANSTADLFYSGEMAKELLDELALSGAVITKEDFLNYKVKITKGFTANIDNMTIHTSQLPTSGPLLAFMLKAISRKKELFPNARWTFEGTVSFYHQIIEIFKHTYAQRALLGDPAFDNVEPVLAKITSDKYVDYVLSRIDPKRTFDQLYYSNVSGAESHGTSHVAVADAYGNVVSASSTVNGYFGSKILSKSTGIIFNNEMDDFSFPNVTNSYGVPPTDFNHIEPGKRPLSSMCPAVIADSKTGDLKLAIGGSGGTQITTAVALVAIRNLLFGDSIKPAIDAPRLHHQLFPNAIRYEANFPRDILSGLEKLGHKTTPIVGRSAVIVGVTTTKDGVLKAGTEYRKGGSVDGKVSEPVGQKQLKEEKVGKPSFLMYFAATAALFGGLSTAVVLAYTSPAFLSMGEPDSSPSITDEEVKSWISSIAALGAAIGALVAGPMSSKYGRKMSLILNNCTFLVGWSCIILAEDESMIMIGRFITGFGAGYMSGCVPLYIVEITTTSVRGFFGAGFQLSNTIGQLLTNAVGTVVDWKTLAILSGIPALIMPIMMLFAPETPVYLMSKYGAKTKTATSLRRLRSDKHITTELEMLASMPREKPPMILNWQQLRQPIVYKPLFLSLGLFLFQQLSGITAITFYQAEIFAKSGSSLNPGTCAILTSAAQVVATLFSSLVVDKCGRKILLYISGLGHVCSLSALAYFFYMKDVPGFLEQNGWLALVSLVVFIVSYSVGFGPVPWMMGAEMTPYFASGFVNALAPSFNWTLGFLISKNFEAIQLLLSPAVAYAIFAFMSLLSIIFVKLFLPETSGKTSEEIERMFRKK